MTAPDHQFGTLPSERMAPSFAPEEEHMAENLKPQVMGPPAYASPDPATLEGRLVPVEEHPLDLSEDYGKSVLEAPTLESVTGTDYAPSSRTPEGEVEGLSDDDRDNWTKADWQAKAKAYGLSTSGTKAELQESVEGYEGEVEADKAMTATEWVAEVEAAKDADELADVRERYGNAGASFATADSAFEKKSAEFDSN